MKARTVIFVAIVLVTLIMPGCAGTAVGVGVYVPMGGPWGPHAYPPPPVLVGRPY
jgi:predicted small secreted protein